jgi:hypothetical protein
VGLLGVAAATLLLFLAELFLLEAVRSVLFVMGTPLAEPSRGLAAETAALAVKTTKRVEAALEVTLAQADEAEIGAIVLTGQQRDQAAAEAAEGAVDLQRQEAAEAEA